MGFNNRSQVAFRGRRAMKKFVEGRHIFFSEEKKPHSAKLPKCHHSQFPCLIVWIENVKNVV